MMTVRLTTNHYDLLNNWATDGSLEGALRELIQNAIDHLPIPDDLEVTLGRKAPPKTGLNSYLLRDEIGALQAKYPGLDHASAVRKLIREALGLGPVQKPITRGPGRPKLPPVRLTVSDDTEQLLAQICDNPQLALDWIWHEYDERA